MTEYIAFSCISTRSATPMATAPPEPPSPITHATDGDAQPHHRKLAAGDPAALTVLLGEHARVGAGRIDQREDGEAVAIREVEQPDRLAIALRERHAEVAARPLVDVPALLMADERDRAAVEASEAGDESRVVGVQRSPWSSKKSSKIRST